MLCSSLTRAYHTRRESCCLKIPLILLLMCNPKTWHFTAGLLSSEILAVLYHANGSRVKCPNWTRNFEKLLLVATFFAILGIIWFLPKYCKQGLIILQCCNRMKRDHWRLCREAMKRLWIRLLNGLKFWDRLKSLMLPRGCFPHGPIWTFFYSSGMVIEEIFRGF